ncbi:hypothetical protein FEZ33_11220 [Ruoffia tabacinasalis]|uniref:PhnB-like domain-containing protein n=1 Tax=Ruoffia tabacinasalis TaxID=87458 RepID=A0A5R9DSP2_9LACT|nr:hypothetical protein FEZ33_11220 [Ruoffia tabacinasalis]HBY89430.1 hypothetical protein [Aerococcaceae bacterium]
MRQLVSALWFDKEAEEAGNFYTSISENSRIIRRETFKDTLIGDYESMDFELKIYHLKHLMIVNTLVLTHQYRSWIRWIQLKKLMLYMRSYPSVVLI